MHDQQVSVAASRQHVPVLHVLDEQLAWPTATAVSVLQIEVHTGSQRRGDLGVGRAVVQDPPNGRARCSTCRGLGYPAAVAIGCPLGDGRDVHCVGACATINCAKRRRDLVVAVPCVDAV